VIEQRNCPAAARAAQHGQALAGRRLGARGPRRPYLALHHEVVVFTVLDMIDLKIFPALCDVVCCSWHF
jgi:hypothetical protein